MRRARPQPDAADRPRGRKGSSHGAPRHRSRTGARTTELVLGPLTAPVRFTDCPELVEAVRTILPGWSVKDVTGADVPRPLMRIRRTEKGYRRVSRWKNRPSLVREKVRSTVVGALCGFHFELIDWYAEEHPDQLCLHAAAVQLGEGLVVFPALARAGKSVLTATLASLGVRVYGDDVVPVDVRTRRGVALGIVPRLRPPLPPDVSSRLRAFVRSHAGPGYRNRLYVTIPSATLAPLGETAPVKGIVLLERGDEGSARVEDVDPAEALETLILQNFSLETPTDRVLDALHAVVLGARCCRLRYTRSEEAAALLLAEFGARVPKSTRARAGEGRA